MTRVPEAMAEVYRQEDREAGMGPVECIHVSITNSLASRQIMDQFAKPSGDDWPSIRVGDSLYRLDLVCGNDYTFRLESRPMVVKEAAELSQDAIDLIATRVQTTLERRAARR